MGFGPIGDALRVYSQVPSGSPQVHTIHIKLNCLLPNFSTVTAGFLDRGVLAATQIAPIPLTARRGFANLMLLVSALTFWAFHHPILPINLGTPGAGRHNPSPYYHYLFFLHELETRRSPPIPQLSTPFLNGDS